MSRQGFRLQVKNIFTISCWIFPPSPLPSFPSGCAPGMQCCCSLPGRNASFSNWCCKSPLIIRFHSMREAPRTFQWCQLSLCSQGKNIYNVWNEVVLFCWCFIVCFCIVDGIKFPKAQTIRVGCTARMWKAKMSLAWLWEILGNAVIHNFLICIWYLSLILRGTWLTGNNLHHENQTSKSSVVWKHLDWIMWQGEAVLPAQQWWWACHFRISSWIFQQSWTEEQEMVETAE